MTRAKTGNWQKLACLIDVSCFTGCRTEWIIKSWGRTMATILKSWKEIAHHFKAGVRTVQRWERLRGLPVYRARGIRRGPVLAYRAELNAWLHSQRAAKDHARNRAKNTPPALSTSRCVAG